MLRKDLHTDFGDSSPIRIEFRWLRGSEHVLYMFSCVYLPVLHYVTASFCLVIRYSQDRLACDEPAFHWLVAWCFVFGVPQTTGETLSGLCSFLYLAQTTGNPAHSAVPPLSGSRSGRTRRGRSAGRRTRRPPPGWTRREAQSSALKTGDSSKMEASTSTRLFLVPRNLD